MSRLRSPLPSLVGSNERCRDELTDCNDIPGFPGCPTAQFLFAMGFGRAAALYDQDNNRPSGYGFLCVEPPFIFLIAPASLPGSPHQELA